MLWVEPRVLPPECAGVCSELAGPAPATPQRIGRTGAWAHGAPSCNTQPVATQRGGARPKAGCQPTRFKKHVQLISHMKMLAVARAFKQRGHSDVALLTGSAFTRT